MLYWCQRPSKQTLDAMLLNREIGPVLRGLKLAAPGQELPWSDFQKPPAKTYPPETVVFDAMHCPTETPAF